jgi:hypothetical protein
MTNALRPNLKTRATEGEPQTLEELDSWCEENDLGSLIPEDQGDVIPGLATKRAGRPRIGKKITLTLPEDTIEDLRVRGAKLGLGYQTYARMVLMGLSKDEKAG